MTVRIQQEVEGIVHYRIWCARDFVDMMTSRRQRENTSGGWV